MQGNHAKLWQQLSMHGIVQGTMPKIETRTPWYVRVLLAMSGWLGAIFILLFVFAAFNAVLENPIACFITGLPLLILAYLVLTKANGEFFEHIAIALSLTAQALLVFALSQWVSKEAIWLVCAMLQVALIWLMPSMLHRIFSSVIAAFCLSVYLATLGVLNVLPSVLTFGLVWLSLREFRYPDKYPMVSGLVYGLTASIVLLQCAQVFSLQPQDFIWNSSIAPWLFSPWDSKFLYISVLLFGAWKILDSNQINVSTKPAKITLALTFVFAVLSMNAQGVGLGLLILLLGFSRQNQVLMAMGIIALLLFCSAYYYLLEQTLLVKAGIMLLIAVFALICRWIVSHAIFKVHRG